MGAAALGIRNLLILERRQAEGGDQPDAKAGVRSRLRRPVADARIDRDRRAADRHQGCRRRRASSSAPPTRRSIRSPTGSRPAEGQGRGRRAIRADPVLHGCRRASAATCARLAEAGVMPRARDADRRQSAALGEIGELDEQHLFGTIIPDAMIARLGEGDRSGRRRPAHLRRVYRGDCRDPRRRRRAHHGAGQRRGGAGGDRGGAPTRCRSVRRALAGQSPRLEACGAARSSLARRSGR